jgi:PAS domain S-box-containing protein
VAARRAPLSPLRITLMFLLAAGAAVLAWDRAAGWLIGDGRGGPWREVALLVATGAAVYLLLVRDRRVLGGTLEDLADSEAKARAVVELSPDGIVTIDERGTMLDVNQTVTRIFGYSREELIGSNVSVLMPTPDRERHDGFLTTYARTGQAKIIGIGREVMGRRKDGSAVPLHLSVKEVRLAGRRLFTGFLHDLTGSKQSEEALRRSEAMYRLVVQSVREYAIFLIGPGGHVQTWNEGAERMYGRTAEEAIGRHISEFRTEEDRERGAPDTELREAAERGAHVAESWRVRRDGTRFWASVLTTTLRDADGRLRGYSRVTRDQTAEREAAERLRESEERYRRLVDEAPVGIFVNQDGRFVYANAEAQRIFGATGAEDLLGRDVLERVHAESMPQALDRLMALESGTPVVSATSQTWLRLDGQPVDVSVASAVIIFGRRPAYQVVFRDETARRKAEAGLLEAKETLEQRVRARTEELERLNAELRSFTYSVSHDLRAPIRHIDGFVRLLEERDGPRLSAEGRRYLETVRASAQRMGALIDDLLRLSRLGRETLRPARLEPEAMVRAIWEEIGGPKTGATLEVMPLPPVEADPALLRQVWQNLLDNALKYSGQRPGARVIVDVLREDGRVWYRVSDNGVGFDPRYADKLFNVFQRLHRAEDFPGTGVGLAIVKKVVELHGGRVRARGAPGQGASFEFTLGAES